MPWKGLFLQKLSNFSFYPPPKRVGVEFRERFANAEIAFNKFLSQFYVSKKEEKKKNLIYQYIHVNPVSADQSVYILFLLLFTSFISLKLLSYKNDRNYSRETLWIELSAMSCLFV